MNHNQNAGELPEEVKKSVDVYKEAKSAISLIKVWPANLDHIAKTGVINGSLQLDLIDLFKKAYQLGQAAAHSHPVHNDGEVEERMRDAIWQGVKARLFDLYSESAKERANEMAKACAQICHDHNAALRAEVEKWEKLAKVGPPEKWLEVYAHYCELLTISDAQSWSAEQGQPIPSQQSVSESGEGLVERIANMIDSHIDAHFDKHQQDVLVFTGITEAAQAIVQSVLAPDWKSLEGFDFSKYRDFNFDKLPAPVQMSEEAIVDAFTTNSDCYADTWKTEGGFYPDDPPQMVEGPVVRAITLESFIKAIHSLQFPQQERGAVDFAEWLHKQAVLFKKEDMTRLFMIDGRLYTAEKTYTLYTTQKQQGND